METLKKKRYLILKDVNIGVKSDGTIRKRLKKNKYIRLNYLEAKMYKKLNII